jgi:hypothetical protein
MRETKNRIQADEDLTVKTKNSTKRRSSISMQQEKSAQQQFKKERKVKATVPKMK